MPIKLNIFRFTKGLDLIVLTKISLLTLAASAFPVLIDPYLKARLNPDLFGEFEVYLKTLPIFALLLTNRQEVRISSSKDIKQLTSNLIFKSTIFAIIISLCSYFFSKQDYFGIIVGGYLVALINILVPFLFRSDIKESIGFQKLIRRTVEVLVILMFTGLSAKIKGNILIISSNIALSISVVYLLIKGSILKKPQLKLSLFNYSFWFRDYKTSFYLSLGEMINLISLSALTYITLIFFEAPQLNNLELSFKFLGIPQLLFTSIIGTSIQTTIGAKFVKRESIYNYVRKVFILLFAISIITCVTLYFITPYVIEKFYSDEWESSGKYVIILLPQLFAFIIFSPLSRILYSLRRENKLFNWQIIKFLLILISFLFTPKSNYIPFLLSFSITVMIAYFLIFYFINKEVNQYELEIEQE